MDKQLIKDFLHKHELCVISTIDDKGNPGSAVVGFSENDSLELMIGTDSESRKYHNILKRPKVSVVVGWDDGITVQYEGEARLLEGDELSEYQKNHFAKMPDAEKYKDLPTEVYFAISPKWIRYTDCTKEPWEVKEITL